jgi:type III secretion protein D
VLCTIITAQLFPTSTSVGDTETNMMEQVEAEPTISIEEFLATAGYTDLLVDRKTQPALPIITGIVNTKKDVLAIEQWLTANAMTARVSVELTSNYKVAAESILALLELDEIQISLSETPGELIATGRTGYPDKWAEAKRKIESEVAGLKVLTDSVVGIDEELMFLTEEIELAGITDEIILQHESTHINVQLWLHPQNVATWHRIQARFEKIFSADKLQVVPIIITGIDVRGVSLGKSPFIRTADGSQYSVGDRLPNGFTLYQISQDHLIFTSGGKYAKYPIGKA